MAGSPIYSFLYLQMSRMFKCRHYTEVLSMKGSSPISNEVAIGVVWSPSGTVESFILPLHPQNPNHNKIA